MFGVVTQPQKCLPIGVLGSPWSEQANLLFCQRHQTSSHRRWGPAEVRLVPVLYLHRGPADPEGRGTDTGGQQPELAARPSTWSIHDAALCVAEVPYSNVVEQIEEYQCVFKSKVVLTALEWLL